MKKYRRKRDGELFYACLVTLAPDLTSQFYPFWRLTNSTTGLYGGDRIPAEFEAEFEEESQFRALTALTSPPKTETPDSHWNKPCTFSGLDLPDPRQWKTWEEMAKTPDRVVVWHCPTYGYCMTRSVSLVANQCPECRFREVAEEPEPSAWGPLERLPKYPDRKVLFRNVGEEYAGAVGNLSTMVGLSCLEYAEVPR